MDEVNDLIMNREISVGTKNREILNNGIWGVSLRKKQDRHDTNA